MRTRWVKTPRASGTCLEMAKLPHGDFAIRNEQFPARTVIGTPAEFRAFITAVKSGRFDKLMEVPK